jgi:L-iditol 2-dehydrogenase
MRKILAAVLAGPNRPMEVQEFHEPELEQGSALLKVTLSEVCGTDVHLQLGHLHNVPYPIIPGHVSVGMLDKIRGTLRDANENVLREGDSVTFLDVHRTCNVCWYCSVAKAGTRCPHRKVYGVTYGTRDGLAGGWAQALYLKPGTRCVRLDGVDPERFMAGGCSLPTALHAVELAQVSFGATVLVLGSGPVGLSAIICADLRGAHRVLCIGAPETRLQIASRVGAHGTLDFSKHTRAERIEWVYALTHGRGADITIEATGNPEAVVDSMRYTRDAGRVIVVGQYTNVGETSFNPHFDLNKKHLEVFGCWGCEFTHVHRAAQLLSEPSRSSRWSPIPLQRYGLTQTESALDEVAKGCAHKALIDPWCGDVG